MGNFYKQKRKASEELKKTQQVKRTPQTTIEDLLEEVFSYVREEGRIPWVNEEEKEEDHVTIDEICIHGESWVSQYLEKDEETGLWEWDGEGENEMFCPICLSDCECQKPHFLSCPNCKELWPKLPDTVLIDAWKNRKRLILETKCKKCGSDWMLRAPLSKDM